MVVIVPYTAPDVARAIANLIAYYDNGLGRQPHKRYLTEDEVVARLLDDYWDLTAPGEDIPSPSNLVFDSQQRLGDPILLDVILSDFEDVTGEMFEDKYGIYVLSEAPLDGAWTGWHIGGRWEGTIRGAQPTIETKCLCASREKHVQFNSCTVADLSMAVLPDILVTPDAAWYSRQGLSVAGWKEIIKGATRRFQTDLAVGIDCCVPCPEIEDASLMEEEEEAWERDREADPSDPIAHVFPMQIPSGLPPFLSNQARIFFRYVAFLRRLRQRIAAEIRMTAQDWLSEWLHLIELYINQTTQKRYERIIRRFLFWYESKTQQPLILAEITPTLVTSYCFALQHEILICTLRYHLQVLRRWCAWLMQGGDLSSETVERLALLLEYHKTPASGDASGKPSQML